MMQLYANGAFDFTVAPGNEAREPAEARGVARDRVRMLVSGASGQIVHARFDAIAEFLRPGDLVVANDSATLPAALRARRADGTATTVHVAGEHVDGRWIVEPREGTAAGETLHLPGDVTATIVGPCAPGSPRLWFARIAPTVSRANYLKTFGSPIRYGYASDGIAISYYETIFARATGDGSAEMPSAGRPFTAHTLDTLRERGVHVRTITLHTGVSSPEAHEPPQDEYFDVPAQTAAAVGRTRARGGRVVAIGTTVVRALESAVRGGTAVASRGWTQHLVGVARPPVVVDALLTGFHEPRASHLAMLEAFAGRPSLRKAYEAALSADYLWHEFGDVHLVFREPRPSV